MNKTQIRNLKKEKYYISDFNGYLSKFLGFTIKAENKIHFLMKKYKSIEAPYMHNIHANTPKCIIVTCETFDERVFGVECI